MKIVLKQLGKWILRHILRKGAEEVIERLDTVKAAPALDVATASAKALKQKQRNIQRRKRKAAKKANKGFA